MRLLVISQVYWPDTAATSQLLTDLCESFVQQGHPVTVYAASRLYEDPGQRLPARETRKGVEIRRLPITGFSKKTLLGRLINFASFNLLLTLRLLLTSGRSYDAILGMTSPPMISWIGAHVARLKKKRFFYWAMDLQPELAIQSGLLHERSLAAKLLRHMADTTISAATHTFALDTYMAQYLSQRNRGTGSISVSRLWPVVETPWQGNRLENPFRQEHGFGDRFVIMYSGNHALVHPLDTLLECARDLSSDPRFLFVFIGGGVRAPEVTQWKELHRLDNVVQLPYQPRSRIHLSLSSADMHVVILGDGQVGYTHPNKIYGAMMMARPFLYIGPQPSHIGDIARECDGNLCFPHGAGSELARSLTGFHEQGPAVWEQVGQENRQWAENHLSPDRLQREMIDAMTASAAPAPTSYEPIEK